MNVFNLKSNAQQEQEKTKFFVFGYHTHSYPQTQPRKQYRLVEKQSN